VAATVLREGFDRIGIKLKSWSGAGAAGAAVYLKHKVPRHYEGWVHKKKGEVTEDQKTAHASYYGGHIQLVRQGYMAGVHHSYDKRSAYPDEMRRLPSMINGRIKYEKAPLWEEVEDSSKISQFFIRWKLPWLYVDHVGNVRVVPFFPLPYRLQGGGS
jgi:hypothetical protein